MTAHSWTASAAEFSRVKSRLLDGDATPEELEAQAAKLMQRARDIRHTLRLNAIEAARMKVPRCPTCDSPVGDVHFGWCSFNGAEAWTVVE